MPPSPPEGQSGRSNELRPIYITTPIYYVNDRPHIGHAYTTTVCDVYARAMRSLGRDVFFLTGTDEHGVKVEASATAHGHTPQEWADLNAAEFQRLLGVFGLTNDDFIRTTEPRHVRQVQAIVSRLHERGDIYLGKFEGWYDAGQEEYYTETRAKELEYRSPVSGAPLVRASEENWYFRLSAFQTRLETLLREHPEFVRPEARRNEVLGRLRDGLQDVPISRTSFRWGVPIPWDQEHVIYVWIDALCNYATGIGVFGDDDVPSERARYWPATYHVIGKEILWFHAVIWPAMLMALELPLPKCVYAHSFWIADGRKMSKSLGNFIDLETIAGYIDRYGLDAWRYHMIARGPLGVNDADFSAKHFHEAYTTDLVNTVGNCASRVTAMIGKYFDGILPPIEAGFAADVDHDWPALCRESTERALSAYERLELDDAAANAIGLVRRIDGYINATEPFRLAKDPTRRQELAAILAQCAEALCVAGLLLRPIMPERMGDLLDAIGAGDRTAADALPWPGLTAGTAIRKVALFPRVDAPDAG